MNNREDSEIADAEPFGKFGLAEPNRVQRPNLFYLDCCQFDPAIHLAAGRAAASFSVPVFGVIQGRPEPEVGRIDTGLDITPMQDTESIGNEAIRDLPHHSMCPASTAQAAVPVA